MPAKHRNGETRTCPYCGQRSTFSERLRVPGSEARPAQPGDSPPAPEYKPGWECDNKHCSHRYDFSKSN